MNCRKSLIIALAVALYLLLGYHYLFARADYRLALQPRIEIVYQVSGEGVKAAGEQFLDSSSRHHHNSSFLIPASSRESYSQGVNDALDTASLVVRDRRDRRAKLPTYAELGREVCARLTVKRNEWFQ
jgi:hypothetical protein